LKTLGIIPARKGSKRLARKNVRPLGGKPLVIWTIEAARAARRLDRLVVSSDDPEVLALAAKVDPRLPLERPAELADDRSPAIDYVRHALGVLEAAGEGPFEAVAILQPSSPLTLSADIDATIELLDSSGADSAVSVMRLDHAAHPLKMKVLEGDRLLPYIEEERGRMAAHELSDVYVRNCSVYATRRRAIDRGQVIGDDCRGYVMPRERSLDINDEFDLLLAEFLLTRCPRPLVSP
jgi:CMP-N-acetylneuraminic acid synthetase